MSTLVITILACSLAVLGHASAIAAGDAMWLATGAATAALLCIAFLTSQPIVSAQCRRQGQRGVRDDDAGPGGDHAE